MNDFWKVVRIASGLAVVAILLLALGCDRTPLEVPHGQEPQWENLSKDGDGSTARHRVDGGWVFRERYEPTTNCGGVALCFVPDPAPVRS